jgi:acetyl esterase/lipase
VRSPLTPVALHILEFDPPSACVDASHNPVGCPALLLIHGSGWKTGTPSGMSVVAHQLAYADRKGEDLGQRFIVFAVEYRLACETTMTNPDIAELCGWNANTTDIHLDGTTDTHDEGKFAAVHDIGDAISWIRNHYDPNHPRNNRHWHPAPGGATWDRKHVVALGGSAGGHLAFMAASLGKRADTRPDEVAAWSPILEMSRLPENGRYPCDGPLPDGGAKSAMSSNPDYCWSATNNYLDCGDNLPVLNPDCAGAAGPNRYAAGSPINHFDFEAGPPAFFAFGGGPLDLFGVDSLEFNGPESVPPYEGVDFDERFVQASGSPPHALCVVNEPHHAWDLVADSCNTVSGHTVMWSTVDFLAKHLPR